MVQLRKGQPVSLRCHPCGARHRVSARPDSWSNREGHPRWKGGRHVTSGGYIQIVVPLSDPLLVMADARGRVYEHRLVMARHLDRPLKSQELVHHMNGDKEDNRLENLEIIARPVHSAEHHKEIQYLRTRVQDLERRLAQATYS